MNLPLFVPSLPVLTPADFRGPRHDWRAGLPSGRLVSYSRGRHALGAAVEGLVRPGAPVALPAFICDSAVEPFRRTGRPITFYAVDERLRVRPDALAEVASAGACVVLVHFFGVPDPELERQVEAVSAAGGVLVEDCAHALYGRFAGRPLGSLGAAAVFSPRKTLPAPDGGLLVTPGEGVDVVTRSTRASELLRLGVYSFERGIGISPRTRLLARESVRRRLSRVDDAVAERPARVRPRLTGALLRSADGARIAARRRENYRYLARALAAEVPDIAQPHATIADGCAPLMLPLVVPRARDQLAAALYRRDISIRAMWDVLPEEIPLARFPDSRRLRDGILCAPVHQGLGARDLNRLVDVIKQEWARL